MKLKFLFLIIALLALFVVITTLFFVPSVLTPEKEKVHYTFSLLEMGRAGNNAYAVINYRGETNLRMLSYQNPPFRKVIILNDSTGIAMTKLAAFSSKIQSLKKYGFEVQITDEKLLGNALFIIPTGALPKYVLDDITHNVTPAKILYLGKTDLVLHSDGVKKQNWYNSLSKSQKQRLVVKDTTLDELMDGNVSLFLDEILENKWDAISSTNKTYFGSGKTTLLSTLNNGTSVRLIYTQKDGSAGFVDSKQLLSEKSIISSTNNSIFPWEKTKITFTLGKTSGTATMKTYLNGIQVHEQELQRVADQNVFIKILNFKKPGDYIIKVSDNTGVIASGSVHVKKLLIKNYQSIGNAYYFNVTVDGVSVDNEKATVNLENSTMKKDYFVTQGSLTVRAQLQKGTNFLNIRIFGTDVKVSVSNKQESVIDVYLKWGIPVLLIIAIVYFAARMVRRPIYLLRIGESAKEVRKEVHIKPSKALDAFKKVRAKMGVGKSPITALEYAIALKKYITEGAEVTEGNVDEMLKQLVKMDLLVSHKRYYQLKGEGNVKRNTLSRQIREALIQSGIPFQLKNDKYVTQDYEIGLYGAKFKKKALIVLDEKKDIKKILSHLTEKAKALLRIKEKNGLIEFISIKKLGERL